MKIELVNPNLLKPYDSNPRKNKDAVSLIKKSINEFGFRQPIVVDEDNIILVGHTRLLAAKELELKKVPVHKVTHLSDAQKLWKIGSKTLGTPHFVVKGNISDCLEEVKKIIKKYVPKRNKIL